MALMSSFTPTQIATICNELFQQASGGKSLAPVSTANFVAVAQTALQIGADPMINAISQMLARTIFSIRPYSEKFRELERDDFQFGNMVRKLQVIDQDFVEDDRFKLENGQSMDMYIVRKPAIVQTNFYGQSVYSDYWTTFKDQFDTAFSSMDEFQRFLAMIVQNKTDKRIKNREDLSRATICNLIGGCITIGGERVIHVLAEYNAATGKELTAANYQAPENFPDFVKWLYSRVMDLSDLLTERSERFHSKIDGNTIERHTPKEMQHLYLLSPFKHAIQARVFADTFHPDRLEGMNGERVTYWQSIKDNERDSIDVTPSTLKADGTVEESAEVKATGILGVIFDAEAVGINHFNRWQSTTPFNSRGGYWDTWIHETDRYINDFSENSVVLKLD